MYESAPHPSLHRAQSAAFVLQLKLLDAGHTTFNSRPINELSAGRVTHSGEEIIFVIWV